MIDTLNKLFLFMQGVAARSINLNDAERTMFCAMKMLFNYVKKYKKQLSTSLNLKTLCEEVMVVECDESKRCRN